MPFNQSSGIGSRDAAESARVAGGTENGNLYAGSAPCVARDVTAAVGCDLIQPGPQRSALLKSAQSTPCAEERLLEHVLGVVHRAKHPVAVKLQLATVRVCALSERGLITGAREGDLAINHREIVAAPIVINAETPALTKRGRDPIRRRGVSAGNHTIDLEAFACPPSC
jgi:hypothetical protein